MDKLVVHEQLSGRQRTVHWWQLEHFCAGSVDVGFAIGHFAHVQFSAWPSWFVHFHVRVGVGHSLGHENGHRPRPASFQNDVVRKKKEF